VLDADRHSITKGKVPARQGRCRDTRSSPAVAIQVWPDSHIPGRLRTVWKMTGRPRSNAARLLDCSTARLGVRATLNVLCGVMRVMDRDFRDYVVARTPALLRTAYLLTGDRGEAEDLLQEALFRLSRAWRRVNESMSLDAYVRRTMVNLCISRWRRRRLRTLTVAAVPERWGADIADHVLDRDEIWRALSAVPPRMRAVLVLRFYEDLSEVDTAAVLGCAVGTVKSQTARGLVKLRNALPEGAPQC
jgi:RNA polymerase sigma-70 factor (ECF subfamily)